MESLGVFSQHHGVPAWLLCQRNLGQSAYVLTSDPWMSMYCERCTPCPKLMRLWHSSLVPKFSGWTFSQPSSLLIVGIVSTNYHSVSLVHQSTFKQGGARFWMAKRTFCAMWWCAGICTYPAGAWHQTSCCPMKDSGSRVDTQQRDMQIQQGATHISQLCCQQEWHLSRPSEDHSDPWDGEQTDVVQPVAQ